MQITRPRGEYVEKIVRDTNGRLVRLSFCVYENGGHIKARLLNAVCIEEHTLQNKTLILPSLKSTKKYGTKVFKSSKTVSPYFNLNLLNFLVAKPRAPTHTK